jgi:PPOX class probable F420-dependent enzyme
MTKLTDDVRSLFDGTNFAHIATLLPDGSPHSVPMWTAIEGDRIVIMTGPESRKARNLARDPRVAISIVDEGNMLISVHVRGRLAEVLDGEAAWTIIDRLANKYIGMDYPREQDRVVMFIEPEHAKYIKLG